MMCGGCGEVGYCSKECQTTDWKDHKKVCKKKHKPKPKARNEEESHLRSEASDEVPVVWEDQQRLNTFGRANNRLREYNDKLEELKTQLAGLDDANGDIECLLDDDACRIQVGDLFVDVSNDDAAEYATKKADKIKAEMADIEVEVKKIQEEMAKLKVLLYAKFGNNINLETSQ